MMRAFRWNSHLSEQRLFDCYLAERTGEGVDPRTAEHMADCSRCHGQYMSLVGTMDEVWTAGDRETSAMFSPEFLKNQQEQIARRLELVEHPGRVISFPAQAESGLAGHARPALTTVSRMAAGWIAAAAAAGLVVGAGVGFLYEKRMHEPNTPAAIAQPAEATPAAPVRVDQTPEPEADDDSLLMSEVQATHESPRTEELLAFDTLTPHVREIAFRVR